MRLVLRFDPTRLAKAAEQLGLFSSSVNNPSLRPEKRMDRRGRLVTRHVRTDHGTHPAQANEADGQGPALVTTIAGLRKVRPRAVLVDQIGVAYQAVQRGQDPSRIEFVQAGNPAFYTAERMAQAMPLRLVDGGAAADGAQTALTDLAQLTAVRPDTVLVDKFGSAWQAVQTGEDRRSHGGQDTRRTEFVRVGDHVQYPAGNLTAALPMRVVDDGRGEDLYRRTKGPGHRTFRVSNTGG